MNEVLAEKDTFPVVLKENIAAVVNEDSDKATKSIDEKLATLQKELLRLANSKENYEGVAGEICRPRELKQSVLVENVEHEGKRQRIIEMAEFLGEQPGELEEYDEQLVRRLIEKVTIFEEKFKVEFKSGVECDVKATVIATTRNNCRKNT
ncbi:DNA recombinase [Proteinivorax tanatarense]|uniref:DNA recombinase n=1 Tax=Proteinivorax tanatarense TaxID=1260629 RepID=A0AAU7VK69_9FIRM